MILPGAIDVHLHLGHGKDIARPRVPADADRESAAAATGGITCFVPYLMATERFEDGVRGRRAVTEAGCAHRFRLPFHHQHRGAARRRAALRRDYGAPSFKIFMNNRGGEGKRLGLPDIDDGFLFRLCEAAAANGGMVCPHPETIEIAWVLRDRVRQADPDGTRRPAHLERDPPVLRGRRCGAARGLCRAHRRRAAVRRAHLFGRGAERRAAAPPHRRPGAGRNLPALPDPRRDLGRRMSARSTRRCAKRRIAKRFGRRCCPARSTRSAPTTCTATSPPSRAESGRLPRLPRHGDDAAGVAERRPPQARHEPGADRRGDGDEPRQAMGLGR